MNRIWLIFGLALIALSSCVPNRKLVYLQKDDLKNRDEIPKDTVLRTHQLKIREYTIQPLDLLAINFETLSDETDAFDFLSKLTPQQRTSSGGGSGGGNSAQNGILVDGDGYIEFAVLGRMKMAGLTLFAARDSLQAVAGKYLPDVVVRVRLLNFRFTLLGEVNGERTVTSTNTRLTLMEAIGLGGGLGELADRTHIKVVRQVENRTDVYYVNLLKEDFIESPYYYVQQNDVIIVPPLKQRPFRKYFLPNLAVVTALISFTALIITLTR
ncbi:polysaccharide biosynthesis/export family protein [Chryseolinea soli]|uniref:Polysaccharide export protein n=1 Tax=Chryseolinea soli TaxID=2321403 RepID=A0A385SSX8_9BACT|nr:polysaccharide biosynthesis/export family protein [Chryseolinea soli]AYB33095.1 polysaccharide export protein [Chryseolinea soli]